MGIFESRDGTTIADVRKWLEKNKASIERDKAYTCRRWIIETGGVRHFVRYIPTMGEMLADFKKLGVAGFCNKYVAASDGKTKSSRKAIKETSREVRALKKKKVNNKPRIVELQAKLIDLVLERMKIDIDTKHKVKVTAELKAVREEIIELGGSTDIGSSAKENRATGLSNDEMKELRKKGEAKRADKIAKRKIDKGMPKIKKQKSDNDYAALIDEVDEELDIVPAKKSTPRKTALKKPAKKAATKKKQVGGK